MFWRNKQQPDCKIVGVISRRMNSNLNDFLQVRPEEAGQKAFDLIAYVEGKANKNIQITGGARLGKTKLAELLCLKSSEKKIIISFKHFTEYNRDFDLGYRWIDIANGFVPNLWEDRQAFTDAFRTAFFASANSRGLAIDVILMKVGDVMAENPKDFNEFFKVLDKISGRSGWEENIKSIIKSKMQILQRATEKSEHKTVEFNTDMVLDLGNLPDSESKVFFAEYFCRMIYRLEEQRQGSEHVRLVIDEAWRLLANENQQSIIGEMLLQGAYVINLMLISQNYTHLAEQYRGHFGTSFCFRNKNDEDIKILRNFEGLLWEGVTEINDFEFVDLFYSHKKEDVIVWKINYEKLIKEKILARGTEHQPFSEMRAVIAPAREQVVEKTPETQEIHKEKITDDKIIEIVDRAEYCTHLTEITKALGIDREDIEKLTVRRILERLVKEEKIRRKDYVTPTLKPSVKARRFYFSAKNQGESQLHKSMIRDAVSVLEKIKILFEIGLVNQGADIILKDCYLECETSLKASLKEFNQKCLDSDKLVLTICCNDSDKERYSYLESVGLGKTKVVLLNELVDAIKELQK